MVVKHSGNEGRTYSKGKKPMRNQSSENLCELCILCFLV